MKAFKNILPKVILSTWIISRVTYFLMVSWSMLVAPVITSCASLWEILLALTLPIFSTMSPGHSPFVLAATLPGVTWN